jgi:hypothetical protein
MGLKFHSRSVVGAIIWSRQVFIFALAVVLASSESHLFFSIPWRIEFLIFSETLRLFPLGNEEIFYPLRSRRFPFQKHS